MTTKKKRSASAKASGVKRATARAATARKTAPKKKRATAKVATARKTAPKKKRATARAATARKTAPKKKRATARAATARKTAPKKKRATAKVALKPPSAGYLDPAYAAELLAEHRDAKETDDQPAFLHHARTHRDDFAEVLGEDTVETMTSGEYMAEDELNQIVPEERGGPFVETSGRKEFAGGTDPSNPNTATREPFPRVSRQQ